jgi:TolA-binding protein
MNKNERLDDHQKFKELAALAQRGALNDTERLELSRHLRGCASCREASAEYSLIGTQGMPMLAAFYSQSDGAGDWDDRLVRNSLLARIRDEARAPHLAGGTAKSAEVLPIGRTFLPRNVVAQWAAVGIAACVLVAVAFGAYRLGGRTRVTALQFQPVSTAQIVSLASDKKAADDLVTLQTAQLSRLQLQLSAGQQEVARLRDALHSAETRSAALASARTEREEEFRRVSEQRDKLASQLRDAEQAYQLVQVELTTLRNEHDRVQLRTTSLESRIDELTASSRDQERRLKDDEQFLSSDRDIRELMGARKLYIADVFDVDSGSRTRKPFGRVFYTQSKSLIFYAFDLDHEPGVKNASAFQVWGQRDAESGVKNHATNLGILYMDSESNRRWVLRLDDPKQLAEIDAVFVTVEPHGGSQKPTGKPFLYALLRREANHP